MAIKKKEITLDSIKSKFSTKTKYKPETFYNCGDAFMEACGLPGPVLGGINLFLGHTNSSKTTAMIKSAVDAQKRGRGFYDGTKKEEINRLIEDINWLCENDKK